MAHDYDAEEMIEELLDRGNLTKWEESFMVSIADKVDRDIPLSDAEEDKLQQIYDQRM